MESTRHNERGEQAGKVAFLFPLQHGHATQFANFQECIPASLQERAGWIKISGDESPDLIAKLRFLPQKIRYGRHCLWNTNAALAQQREWQAIFLASNQASFISMARRQPTYFYLDLSPSLQRELAPWYDHQLEPAMLLGLRTWRHSLLLHTGRGVFAMSEWAAKGLTKDYRLRSESVHVALPGANLRRWHYLDRSDRSPKRIVRILMVGGQFALKGGNLLLDWAERTPLTNWELDIVTWPSELPEWVKALTHPGPDEKVTFSLGPRLPNVRVHCGLRANTPALMDLFEQADIFCLPTQADGSSIASLEAMACGLPVLVGAVGGIPELIQDGKTGMLMRRSDGQDMQARLETLIQDARLRHCLGQTARGACERFYNVERQIDQIFTVIDRDCR